MHDLPSTPPSGTQIYRTNHNDHQPLLPKLDKHVSFNLEEQPIVFRDEIAIRRKRVTRRRHLGVILLFLGLIAYFQITRFHLNHKPCHRMEGGSMAPSDSSNTQHATFTFDAPDQFILKEVLEAYQDYQISISGNIKISSDFSDQKPAIKVDISMTSENIEIEATNFDKTDTSLEIQTPKLGKKGSFWRRPRLVIEIEIHTAKNTKLSNLEVSTRHLSIDIFSDLSLAVADATTLSAVNGHIHCPTNPTAFTSREKYIRTVSGGIRGEFTLEDVLSVETNSGGIHVSVIPKPASKSHPNVPAAFAAHSISGHIEANFVTRDAPTRDYHVAVKGDSGGISGTYIHGSKTSFTTDSGGLHITLAPFEPSNASELTTTHISGATDVRVLSPLNARKGGTIGGLTSTHRSVSGSLRLYYPSEWKGKFEGSSVSGKLIADGKGLKIDKMSDWPGMKKFTGHKGEDGEAKLEMHSVSGGAEFHVT